MSPRRRTEILVALAISLVLLAILAPMLLRARETARRHQSRNNLKQLGLAFHNYADVFDCLPPGATISQDGPPHHGWFTQMTPYLDSSPFWNELDTDLPWDHPTNADKFQFVYPIAINPSVDAKTTTDGLGLIHYMVNPRAFYRNSSTGDDIFQSARPITWLAGEVARDFQPWGYPFNWREWDGTLNSTPDGYGSPSGTGANILMSDGSVRFIQNEESSGAFQLLKNLPVPPVHQMRKPNRTFNY